MTVMVCFVCAGIACYYHCGKILLLLLKVIIPVATQFPVLLFFGMMKSGCKAMEMHGVYYKVLVSRARLSYEKIETFLV